MSITLIAADEPQPGQPTPDPAPVTGSPWGQRVAALAVAPAAHRLAHPRPLAGCPLCPPTLCPACESAACPDPAACRRAWVGSESWLLRGGVR